MDFQFSYMKSTANFYPHGDYQVEDEAQAKNLLEKSLERLNETIVLGKGFPIGPFKKSLAGLSAGNAMTYFAPEKGK